MLIPVFMEHTRGYTSRTKVNALWGDITIAFALDFTTTGEKNTALYAGDRILQIKVPKNLATISKTELEECVSNSVKQIKRKIEMIGQTGSIKVNIAGNAISRFEKLGICQNDIDAFVFSVLSDALDSDSVAHLRSGGQSGSDEAGVKAAMRLEIPCSILAPKGWKFSNLMGQEILDEQLFKTRFKL